MCDPGLKPGFEEVLPSMMPASIFGSTQFDLTPKVREDPLAVLPYDILHGIVGYLAVKDLVALMTASWHVLSTTRETAFWKHMLRQRISPWFWELNTMIAEATLSDTFDYKALFLWLNAITTPEFGKRGPMMGIANRRRIWNAFQPVTSLYREKISPKDSSVPADEEAKAILDNAVSLHMPIVAYPQPKQVETTSAQFICSWNEISHKSCDFDTYWAEDGTLVGVAVTFGAHQRVFGTTDGKHGQSLHIAAGEWISEIIVYISELDMFSATMDRSQWTNATHVRPARDAGIRGMTVSISTHVQRGSPCENSNPIADKDVGYSDIWPDQESQVFVLARQVPAPLYRSSTYASHWPNRPNRRCTLFSPLNLHRLYQSSNPLTRC